MRVPFGLAAFNPICRWRPTRGALHETRSDNAGDTAGRVRFCGGHIGPIIFVLWSRLADGERTDAHCLPHGFQNSFPNGPPMGPSGELSSSCQPMRCATTAGFPDMVSIARSRSAPRHPGRDGASARPLWALLEALRSAAPQAVAGMIDKLDLKTSQKTASRRRRGRLAVVAAASSQRWNRAPRPRAGGSMRRPARATVSQLHACAMASAA